MSTDRDHHLVGPPRAMPIMGEVGIERSNRDLWICKISNPLLDHPIPMIYGPRVLMVLEGVVLSDSSLMVSSSNWLSVKFNSCGGIECEGVGLIVGCPTC